MGILVLSCRDAANRAQDQRVHPRPPVSRGALPLPLATSPLRSTLTRISMSCSSSSAGRGEHKTPFGCDRLEPGDLVLVRPGDYHYLVGGHARRSGVDQHCRPGGRPGGGCSTWPRSAPGASGTRAACPNGSRLSGDAKARAELLFRQALDVFAGQPRRFDLLRFLLEVLEFWPNRPIRPTVCAPLGSSPPAGPWAWRKTFKAECGSWLSWPG